MKGISVLKKEKKKKEKKSSTLWGASSKNHMNQNGSMNFCTELNKRMGMDKYEFLRTKNGNRVNSLSFLPLVGEILLRLFFLYKKNYTHVF